MIEDYEKRHHPFEGCFNFRDIGGYPTADDRRVRWGRYYRAGRQDRMTAADLARLESLGIRTQIDLRRPDEVEEQGPGPLVELGAEYHNIPVIPEGGTERLSQLVGDTLISGRRYLGYLEFGPESWIRLFDLLATADRHPILLHCTAGKDRTGVSTAFLLAVLGVDRRWIEADYALTNVDVPRHMDYLERIGGLPAGLDREAMTRLAGIPAEAMGDFLDGVEARWGGPVEYLRSIGIGDDTFDAVRRAFLD
jgi:protein-tyrosine phosphatase